MANLNNASFFDGLAVSSDGTAYSLANNGSALAIYDVETPYKSTVIELSGDLSTLSALDFRPATGELIGYDDASDSYVTVNVASGVVTSASGDSVTPTDTNNLDIDWNPTIDRLRTVTESDQNIVYNPETGQASDAATTSLFYADGDVQAGTDPSIVANAYTNSVANAETTQQYALDHASNTLVTLANNAGTLTTVGTLTMDGQLLDFDANAGFDIVTSENGMNTAYATLVTNGEAALYSINLENAEVTKMGVVENAGVTVGANGGLYSALGLDGTSFGIDAGSDFAFNLGLTS